jgi:chromate reductase
MKYCPCQSDALVSDYKSFFSSNIDSMTAYANCSAGIAPLQELIFMSTAPAIRLLGISGSLRAQSANSAILKALRSRVGAFAELTLFGLHEIPPYNADFDGDLAPEPVRLLKQAIQTSDGLVICSPEYNHGTSGVLKNALDWASRPGFESPLKNKPALIMTSSPALTGGVRANHQLRETLAAALSRVICRPQVVIGAVNNKMAGGTFVDEPSLQFALQAIGDLIAEIKLIKSSSTAPVATA